MNILLYSHAFYPSTGGVETVSMALAEGFTRRGIACKVVTKTPQESEGSFPFEVIANPGARQARELLRWADVVLYNGANLGLQPWAFFSRKPAVWVHVGYQASCIDGAGWFDGKVAPLTPLASARHHIRARGWVPGLRDAGKLLVRRWLATHWASANVAITHWMQTALPLPNQAQIYNPFPTERFAQVKSGRQQFDFLYLGRLVSEKGVDVLIKAFAQLQSNPAHNGSRLVIIGDGDRKQALITLASQLGVAASVVFAGAQVGPALAEWVSLGRIAVLPSVWHEPMGGVAVELMAAGRNLIVSQDGGLAECVGDAGLTFPNGDAAALAQQMSRLLDDPVLCATQAARARERAQEFAPDGFIDQYVTLLRDVVTRAH